MDWIKNHRQWTALIGLILVFASITAPKSFWFIIFLIALLATTLAILIAPFKPSIFNRWFKGRATRGRTLKYLGIMFVILFVATMVTTPPHHTAHTDVQPTVKQAASVVQVPKPTHAPAPKPTPVPETKPQPIKQKATFTATTFNINVIDPATVMIPIQVDNTSDVEGKASCTVTASSDSGTYHGWDIFDVPDVIKAKDTDFFNARLTITKEGAAYVTKATVNCEVQ